MKKYICLFLFTVIIVTAQENNSKENFPVFEQCQTATPLQQEACFYNKVQEVVFSNFKVPQTLIENNYQGTIIVVFEVNQKGEFGIQYIDSDKEELAEASKNVFKLFEKVTPPTYNGKPTYSRYTIRIPIPLQKPTEIQNLISKPILENKVAFESKKNIDHPEFENIQYQKFSNPEFSSQLNIPFSHSTYAQFDSSLNQVGTNNHTASKPFTYLEVTKYYDLKLERSKIFKNATSWFEKKLWNENLVQLQGADYWFTMNPILDLQIGQSKSKTSSKTFINTRGIQLQGGLGSQLNFTTTIFETQARFAEYFNNYAQSIKPSGGNPAIVPGIGIAKQFKKDGYDLPMADASLTYTPSQRINLQLGYSRNFIGDGYRSLITTDGINPYPFFKINTNFWKIKYTNTYMWLKDVRPDVTIENTYAKKFMANHYLSWNATKKLNIGFFESVVWADTNNRGFDMSFINPIVFYRSVEFASSSKSGNALLGLTSKYKWNNKVNIYGQFLLDEFSLGDVKKQNNSWKNKFGYQLGAKYYNAFGIENLLVQAEYNQVRPYVYSHSNPLTNYASSNQSLGHQWGANFEELLVIGGYHKNRYFADAKFTVAKRGFDENNLNYGGNIYLDYDLNRANDINAKTAQGNTTKVFIADLQVGYLINPATNLKLFGTFIYRDFSPKTTSILPQDSTTWLSVGVRSDIFNWYFDY